MQTEQATHPLRTKRYWQKLALTVSAAVILTVLVTSEIVSITQANHTSISLHSTSGEYSQEVLTGSIVLNPKGYFFTGFGVPEDAKNATLQGNYSVLCNGTDNNWVTMTIWKDQEFLNYFGNSNGIPCYNKDMMGMHTDNLNIALSKGTYVILISGDSSTENKVLEANLYLNYTIP